MITAADSTKPARAPMARATPPNTAAISALDLELDLSLITDRAAFEALEADWNDLFARAGRPTQVFQTFNWNWHWARHYLPDAEGGVAASERMITTSSPFCNLATSGAVMPLILQPTQLSPIEVCNA